MSGITQAPSVSHPILQTANAPWISLAVSALCGHSVDTDTLVNHYAARLDKIALVSNPVLGVCLHVPMHQLGLRSSCQDLHRGHEMSVSHIANDRPKPFPPGLKSCAALRIMSFLL